MSRQLPYGSSRLQIWNALQHPYKHTLDDFAYTNPSLPAGFQTVNSALDYLFAVLYPNTQDPVATPGDLPTGVDTPNPGDLPPDINDYRIVTDDGDGKAAGYRYYLREGDGSPTWHKIYDLDWSSDDILAAFQDITQSLYVYQQGKTDLDSNGDPITGLFAGQRVWGGDQSGQNLTLDANFVDDTGFVQVNGNFRPTQNDTWDLSTNSERWKDLFLSNSIDVNGMLLASGSITDSSGQIDFDNENLITTGTITSTSLSTGTLTVSDGSIVDTDGTINFGSTNILTTGTGNFGQTTITTGIDQLVLTGAGITSTSGAISFGNENLTTTGNITGAILSGSQLDIDNIRIDSNSITTTNTNGNLIINPDGTGVVSVQKELQTLGITANGIVDVTGQLDVDNITLNGNIISSSGNLELNAINDIRVNATIDPTAGSIDLGSTVNLFDNIYVNNIGDGSNIFITSELLDLRSANYRDAGRTQAAQSGDALFYDGTQWLASAPDTEIDHTQLTNLTNGDAGHTQFALLTGRVGGQVVQGGTSASENLTLESTSNATKGRVQTRDNLTPETDASFSVTWSGTDLGDATHYYRDLFTKGEARGLRLENFTSGTLPSSSAQNVGRVLFSTDEETVYIDSGAALLKVGGSNKFQSDIAFSGAETLKNVDVSSEIDDARTAIIQLLDNANDFERIYTTIKATSASNVRIEVSPALPAGSYRLIVIE